MCKIISIADYVNNKENAAYKNLSALFQISSSVEGCNFYLDTAEKLYEAGKITAKDLYTLRRIGRQKRMTLANPPQEPQKADTAGVYTYTPEMGQQKPDGCQMEASRAYYGKHVYIDTPLALKGRGITFLKTYDSDQLTESGKYKTGWNSYQVTNHAFDLLKAKYAISWESCLD